MEGEQNLNLKSEESFKITTPLAILIAGVLVAGAVLYSKSDSLNQTANPIAGPEKVQVSSDDDAFLGPENAKVTIVEFSDYQCPFCRSFWRETLQEIKKEYIDSGKSVKFVYRDFPLSIHPLAQKYAETAECAGDQEKYWQMHDKIFAKQDDLGQGTISSYDTDDIKGWAGELGLNVSEFSQCLDSNKYAEEVRRDFNDGAALGVGGTPTFFINGIPLVGAQPFSNLKALIDRELNE